MSNRSLTLVLSGPLQSWGSRSKIASRDTEPAPTLSGVLGLVANALGRERTDRIDDLAALDMWVRTDQPGTLLRDYQTAGGGPWGDGTIAYRAARVDANGKQTVATDPVQSHRYYLADAVFLVVLHGPAATIDEAEHALDAPARQIYLGRRSCPPDRPLLVGSSTESPQSIITTFPWQATVRAQRQILQTAPVGTPCMLDTVVPVGPEQWHLGEPRDDIPMSWEPHDRRYRTRFVFRDQIPVTPEMAHPDARHAHPTVRAAQPAPGDTGHLEFLAAVPEEIS